MQTFIPLGSRASLELSLQPRGFFSPRGAGGGRTGVPLCPFMSCSPSPAGPRAWAAKSPRRSKGEDFLAEIHRRTADDGFLVLLCGMWRSWAGAWVHLCFAFLLLNRIIPQWRVYWHVCDTRNNRFCNLRCIVSFYSVDRMCNEWHTF